MRSRLLKLAGTLTIAIAVAWLAPIPTAGQAPVSSSTASSKAAPHRARGLPGACPTASRTFKASTRTNGSCRSSASRRKSATRSRRRSSRIGGRIRVRTATSGSTGPTAAPTVRPTVRIHPDTSPSSIRRKARFPGSRGRSPRKPTFAITRSRRAAIYDYRIRCLPAGTPRGTFFSYYNGWQIQQPPGQVVILYEHNHLYRVIRLDGSPHPGPNIQLWMGDSIGRWEGNTLVVDVRNFTGKTWVVGDLGGEGMHTGSFHSPALHVVERFTFVDADNIDYEATIEDPNVFTKPWKLGFRVFSRAPKRLQAVRVRLP